jgi:hypothetical protein
MELSASREAASCPATQEFPNILCFTGLNSEPEQLSQYHPVLSKIRFNIIHALTFWSPCLYLIVT